MHPLRPARGQLRGRDGGGRLALLPVLLASVGAVIRDRGEGVVVAFAIVACAWLLAIAGWASATTASGAAVLLDAAGLR